VAGEKRLKQELIKQFPDEEKAIRKYFKVVKKTVAHVEKVALLKALPLYLSRFLIWTRLHRLVARGYTMMAKAPLQNILEQLTANKNLQALLAYNYANYGTEPKRAPFLMQALVASHYMNGAYYPRKGPSDIPKKVIQTILDNDGKVLVSAPVAQILVDEHTGNAKGVQMKDGRVIESSIVVSDAGFINTVTKLLPEGLVNIDFAAEYNPNLLHPGSSGLTLFVGLKGNAESLNLPKSNIFIHSSNDLCGTADRIEKLTLEKALDIDPKDFGVIFVGCPSTKDSDWANRHPNKSTLEIITQAPYHWFEKFEHTFDKTTKSHGPEYENAKTRLAEKVWSRVVDVLDDAKLPKTLDAVDHYEVGSPLSYAHYYSAQRGALYGLDLDLKRFEPKTFLLRLRSEIPEVPGLFLTGQDIVVDGMIGAMFGGLLCAQKVLGLRKVISLLRSSKHKKKSNIQ
jgi:all-trans-retinol 13,14-reductase